MLLLSLSISPHLYLSPPLSSLSASLSLSIHCFLSLVSTPISLFLPLLTFKIAQGQSQIVSELRMAHTGEMGQQGPKTPGPRLTSPKKLARGDWVARGGPRPSWVSLFIWLLVDLQQHAPATYERDPLLGRRQIVGEWP